jgi:hypothetical protein
LESNTYPTPGLANLIPEFEDNTLKIIIHALDLLMHVSQRNNHSYYRSANTLIKKFIYARLQPSLSPTRAASFFNDGNFFAAPVLPLEAQDFKTQVINENRQSKHELLNVIANGKSLQKILLTINRNRACCFEVDSFGNNPVHLALISGRIDASTIIATLSSQIAVDITVKNQKGQDAEALALIYGASKNLLEQIGALKQLVPKSKDHQEVFNAFMKM